MGRELEDLHGNVPSPTTIMHCVDLDTYIESRNLNNILLASLFR